MGQTADGKTRARVSQLLAQGHTPREIAERLHITTQAVYQHMDRLKADARSEEATA